MGDVAENLEVVAPHSGYFYIMATTRYFQHLNENNSDFQKVTTLDIIDDSGDMIMYYFKDGSKCNKNYIAPQIEFANTDYKTLLLLDYDINNVSAD